MDEKFKKNEKNAKRAVFYIWRLESNQSRQV